MASFAILNFKQLKGNIAVGYKAHLATLIKPTFQIMG